MGTAAAAAAAAAAPRRRGHAAQQPETAPTDGPDSKKWGNTTGGLPTTNGGGDRKAAARTPRGRIGTTLALLAWFVLIIAASISLHYKDLPKVTDDTTPAAGFSATRARKHVVALAHDIGMRMAGMPSEPRTIQYIKSQLLASRDLAERRVGGPTIEVEEQLVSGGHRFEFAHKTVMKMYTNMTNVIARVSCGPACDDAPAVLVNAHYDSPLGSPGAMDDAASIAVMLEIVRAMAYQPMPPNRAVIFLFNGAEETLQDASHGFITQHRWRESIHNVINLEACGYSGKAILFQAGAPAMVRLMSSVPYPHGTVAANDVFKTGIIVSDTDYRQFVQYGNVSGFDFAFYQNSYLYHTTRDTVWNIDPASLEHMGGNAFALIKQFVDTDILEKDPAVLAEEEKVVYFDLFGHYWVVYTWSTAVMVHVCQFALMFLYLLVSVLRGANPVRLVWAWATSAIGFLAAIAAGALQGALMAYGLQASLRYFSGELRPVLLFGPWAVAAFLWVQSRPPPAGARLLWQSAEADARYPSEWYANAGALLFMMATTAITTLAGIPSSFIFSTIGGSIQLVLLLGALLRPTGTLLAPAAYVLGASPVIAIASGWACMLLDLVTPLTGRMGVLIPGDVVAGAVASLLVALIGLIILPLVHRHPNGAATVARWAFLVGLLVILVASVAVAPFDASHPKRIMALHSDSPAGGSFSVASIDTAETRPVIAAIEAAVGARFTRHGIELPELWDAVFPLNHFVDVYEMPAPAPTFDLEALAAYNNIPLRPPVLTVVDSVYFEHNNTRSITLICDHTAAPWTVLRFEGHVTWWSFEDKIGPADEDNRVYLIRQAGGYGTNTWTFTMHLEGNTPTQFRVTALRFSPSKFMTQAISAVPVWVDTAIQLNVAHGEYDL